MVSEKVRESVKRLPPFPGIYLMKDRQGRILYIGKAVNLRSRVGSYFTKAGLADPRIAEWIPLVDDVDHVQTESEVDAILMEARLVKDTQPPFNKELKDDKTFPYLQIHIREEYPRVEFTRTPSSQGTKLYGPFTSARKLRGTLHVLQKIFRFRNCSLDIEEEDPRWKWYRPCLLYSIGQCTAPCNFRVTKEEYREQIRRLILFLDGKKQSLIDELKEEMAKAASSLKFEQAARIRDDVESLENLHLRGDINVNVQPEVFVVDPKRGVYGLKKIFQLPHRPRRIEGVDIAHLQGGETVASLVQFIDGLPFKHGYKRYKIRSVQGVDDFASIREVVARRFKRLRDDGESFPDLLLIDGGKGQLSAAGEAFQALGITPPFMISIAKQNEELYVPGESEPRRLSRHSYSLRLLQYVRDEAHRFAQHYHHLLRRKSSLDE